MFVKKELKLLSLLIAFVMVFSMTMPLNVYADEINAGMSLEQVIDIMNENIDGEDAFDYMSYVYLGWRTTGGPWQNHVINNYIVGELEKAGYVFSEEDMSSAADDDYVWVQEDDSSSLVWAP